MLVRAAWFALLLITGGCASRPFIQLPEALSVRHELVTVPFIAQADYQCGPAALAMVLQASGVDVSADEIVPRVYLPGRRGSLQTELVAATRQYERLPYVVSGELAELFTHVEAGHPVLVLQNLRLRTWPQWHFAVVVGFDRERGEVILRSGTERRHIMSLQDFTRTWERGRRWGMLALRADQLPPGADPERYLTAAAGLEAVKQLEVARVAYQTARDAWPESHWPDLGLANVAYFQNRFADARALYAQVLAKDPTNLAAHYNLGDTLARQGCPAAAINRFERALEIARDTPVRSRIEARMAEIKREPMERASEECP